MRLPKVTTDQSPQGATSRSGGPATGVSQGIDMMIDITCLLGCGIGVLKCIPCGLNPGCWLKCAGPGAIGCVTGCLGI